ncbi:unnamed protein product [Ectocarpus sp. 12 AP-2014]
MVCLMLVTTQQISSSFSKNLFEGTSARFERWLVPTGTTAGIHVRLFGTPPSRMRMETHSRHAFGSLACDHWSLSQREPANSVPFEMTRPIRLEAAQQVALKLTTGTKYLGADTFCVIVAENRKPGFAHVGPPSRR